MLKWNHHIDHFIKIIFHLFGMYKKKVLPFSPINVAILNSNSFIRFVFFYGLFFWFANDSSGKDKLFSQLEHLYGHLLKMCNCEVLFSIINVYKLQCLTFMYVVMNNFYFYLILLLILMNMCLVILQEITLICILIKSLLLTLEISYILALCFRMLLNHCFRMLLNQIYDLYLNVHLLMFAKITFLMIHGKCLL